MFYKSNQYALRINVYDYSVLETIPGILQMAVQITEISGCEIWWAPWVLCC